MNTRYEFNMDVPPREAIRLLYVSKSRFGGDWNSVPHTHSCTEVFYCVDAPLRYIRRPVPFREAGYEKYAASAA